MYKIHKSRKSNTFCALLVHHQNQFVVNYLQCVCVYVTLASSIFECVLIEHTLMCNRVVENN